jgi:hypothetical protein
LIVDPLGDGISKRDFNSSLNFLCMGRIEKFFLLEKIWKRIKTLRPNSNLVMIGRASPDIIDKFLSVGIDHNNYFTILRDLI